MDVFEHKVLNCVLIGGWYDEGKRLGFGMTTELLKPYGRAGWEVVATMHGVEGFTNQIILKRRRTVEGG